MRLSIQEASHKLGVTEHTIRRRLRKGELQGEQIPRPQGFTWVVVVDDEDVDDLPFQVDKQSDVLEPAVPVDAPTQRPVQVDIPPVQVAPPPPAHSPIQIAELHALRARVAVLEERNQSKNDLIEMLHDRLKSQDWQFGEVLSQLTDVQSRMLPPAPIEIEVSEQDGERQAGGGWLFWRKGRAKVQA